MNIATIETVVFGPMLQPVIYPERAKAQPYPFGNNLTITRGQAVAMKTADKKMYAFATGGGDGTQNFAGFSMYSFKTDANGAIYYGGTAAATYREGPSHMTPVWIHGIFDPSELFTSASPATNVVTFTPGGTIETGDKFTITYTYPTLATASVTFAATAATAANVAAGLVAAWNANDSLAALATASGTTTVILTATSPGVDLNSGLVPTTTEADGSAADAQTFTKANTTASTGRAISDITTSRPGCVVLPEGYWLIPGP